MKAGERILAPTEQSMVFTSDVVISSRTVCHSDWSLTDVSFETALFRVSIPAKINKKTLKVLRKSISNTAKRSSWATQHQPNPLLLQILPLLPRMNPFTVVFIRHTRKQIINNPTDWMVNSLLVLQSAFSCCDWMVRLFEANKQI